MSAFAECLSRTGQWDHLRAVLRESRGKEMVQVKSKQGLRSFENYQSLGIYVTFMCLK